MKTYITLCINFINMHYIIRSLYFFKGHCGMLSCQFHYLRYWNTWTIRNNAWTQRAWNVAVVLNYVFFSALCKLTFRTMYCCHSALSNPIDSMITCLSSWNIERYVVVLLKGEHIESCRLFLLHQLTFTSLNKHNREKQCLELLLIMLRCLTSYVTLG